MADWESITGSGAVFSTSSVSGSSASICFRSTAWYPRAFSIARSDSFRANTLQSAPRDSRSIASDFPILPQPITKTGSPRRVFVRFPQARRMAHRAVMSAFRQVYSGSCSRSNCTRCNGTRFPRFPPKTRVPGFSWEKREVQSLALSRKLGMSSRTPWVSAVHSFSMRKSLLCSSWQAYAWDGEVPRLHRCGIDIPPLRQNMLGAKKWCRMLLIFSLDFV